MAMKPEKRDLMVREIVEDMERHMRGCYTRHTMGWICDRIAWLWKYRHISDKQLQELTDMACEALKVSTRI